MVRQENQDGRTSGQRAAPCIRIGSAGYKWNLQVLAKLADVVMSGRMSPVSALNELGVLVNYSLLHQEGPSHSPSFNVAVTVADMTFKGWGKNKREARAAASRACLSALLEHAGQRAPAPSPHQATISDQHPVASGACPGGSAPAQELWSASSSSVTPVNKCPINVLYANYTGFAFTYTFGDGSPMTTANAPPQLSYCTRFKVTCHIEDQEFIGYGSSKKQAKKAAAQYALAALEGRAAPEHALTPTTMLQQTLADHIAKLVNQKFDELMKDDVIHIKRKVLAGIVITTDNRVQDARVIGVTTGNKCISGEHMSMSGRGINDCHAEVVVRRCLQWHLYSQLLMYANQPDPRQVIPESDVEPAPDGGYRLKASRQVHMYVSTAPCGDGRIFSPTECTATSRTDKHPNRLARGQLRTKIESGEGTIPVKRSANELQTWDGVLQGERLLTMSCSDKVARWCVCGLQGALLSQLLQPVYLHSLVLGSLMHPQHMYRAICGRIERNISSLPPPFHLHRPVLLCAACPETRNLARSPNYAVCWYANMQEPEVVNATTGKLYGGQPSLLCKQTMFARWQYLVKRLPLLPEMAYSDSTLLENIDDMLYTEAKQICSSYQLSKQHLIDAFMKAKLGGWIKRPLEQDQFVCEIADADPTLLFAAPIALGGGLPQDDAGTVKPPV